MCSGRVGGSFLRTMQLIRATPCRRILQMLRSSRGFKKHWRNKKKRKNKKKKKKKNCSRAPKCTETTSGLGRPKATDSWRPGEHPAEAAQHACPVWRHFPGCLPLAADRGGRDGFSPDPELPSCGLVSCKVLCSSAH